MSGVHGIGGSAKQIEIKEKNTHNFETGKIKLLEVKLDTNFKTKDIKIENLEIKLKDTNLIKNLEIGKATQNVNIFGEKSVDLFGNNGSKNLTELIETKFKDIEPRRYSSIKNPEIVNANMKEYIAKSIDKLQQKIDSPHDKTNPNILQSEVSLMHTLKSLDPNKFEKALSSLDENSKELENIATKGLKSPEEIEFFKNKLNSHQDQSIIVSSQINTLINYVKSEIDLNTNPIPVNKASKNLTELIETKFKNAIDPSSYSFVKKPELANANMKEYLKENLGKAIDKLQEKIDSPHDNPNTLRREVSMMEDLKSLNPNQFEKALSALDKTSKDLDDVAKKGFDSSKVLELFKIDIKKHNQDSIFVSSQINILINYVKSVFE